MSLCAATPGVIGLTGQMHGIVLSRLRAAGSSPVRFTPGRMPAGGAAVLERGTYAGELGWRARLRLGDGFFIITKNSIIPDNARRILHDSRLRRRTAVRVWRSR